MTAYSVANILLCREQKLEEREQALVKQQAEASGLKAELQSLTEAMRGEAEKRTSEAAEEKQGYARQQARMDSLQVPLTLSSDFHAS